MNSYFSIKITETGSNSPRGPGPKKIFNVIFENFPDKDAVKNFLVDRYGKMPGMKNKIYRDNGVGGSEQVGFIHSFWNQDISHNSKKWHQTDWVEVRHCTENIVLL